MKVTICNANVDNLSMRQAIERIADLVKRKKPSVVVTPNVDHIVRLHRDEGFLRIYNDAELVLADGAPLLWAARFLGTPLQERVPGSDLLPELCREAVQRGHRLFFFGGRPGAAAGAADRFRDQHKGIQIVGTYCPPYGFEHDETENRKCIARIKEAAPDVLFVGLGSPKQERWIHIHREVLGVPVCIGVGVSFEFVSGMVRRAPRWMQTAGLEWFWRLLMEPRRLWKRYLVDDPRFFGLVLTQRVSRTRLPHTS